MPDTIVKLPQSAYERYWQKVSQAKKAGYSDAVIQAELKRERATIMPRCHMKQAELATDRNPYKVREAARAARECLDAIDRVLSELKQGGNHAA